MSERAQSRSAAEAAEDAVKAYLRIHRARLAEDGEMLALLIPPRFAQGEVRDFQAFAMEKLIAENARLKAVPAGAAGPAAPWGEDVRPLLLELIGARSFGEAIAVALAAAPALGADCAAFCVESTDVADRAGADGVRLIPSGAVATVLGRGRASGGDPVGAILSGGGELLLGAAGRECKSIAAFRLRVGHDTPPALYVLGAKEEGRFDAPELESDLRFVARALERAIRAWLDLPKV
jgi:uncharacterized protein YigA (DUF484 family)